MKIEIVLLDWYKNKKTRKIVQPLEVTEKYVHVQYESGLRAFFFHRDFARIFTKEE